MTPMTLPLNLEKNSIDLKMPKIFYYLRRKVRNGIFREKLGKKINYPALGNIGNLIYIDRKAYDQMRYTASSLFENICCNSDAGGFFSASITCGMSSPDS